MFIMVIMQTIIKYECLNNFVIHKMFQFNYTRLENISKKDFMNQSIIGS